MSNQPRPWVAVFALAVTLFLPTLGLSAPVGIRSPFAEIGLGVSRVEPFVTGGAGCAAIGFGLTQAASPSFAAPRLELRAIHGRNLPNGIPEKANAGKQTLVALLGGVDVAAPRLPSLYLTSGFGIGHAWIKDARGPLVGPSSGAVELRDRTGLAYSVGVGVRSSPSASRARARASLRVDGILKSMSESSAYATTLGIGVTF